MNTHRYLYGLVATILPLGILAETLPPPPSGFVWEAVSTTSVAESGDFSMTFTFTNFSDGGGTSASQTVTATPVTMSFNYIDQPDDMLSDPVTEGDMVFCLTENNMVIDFNTVGAGSMNMNGGMKATWETGIGFTVDAAGANFIDDVSPGQDQGLGFGPNFGGAIVDGTSPVDFSDTVSGSGSGAGLTDGSAVILNGDATVMIEQLSGKDMFALDASDFTFTLSGTVTLNQTYVKYTLVPIPEPATTLLVGLETLGLAVRRRRFS